MKTSTILKSSIFVLIFFSSQISFAAEKDSINNKQFKNLIPKGRLGVYAGPYFRYTMIDGNWTDISGGGGGIYLDNKFYIAGNSYGQWNPGPSKTLPGKLLGVTMNGVALGYCYNPYKVLHMNTGIFAGGGATTVLDQQTNVKLATLNLAYVCPMVDFEINLYQSFRFFVGLDYRFAFSKDSYMNLNADKFSGMSVYWGIKTGLF